MFWVCYLSTLWQASLSHSVKQSFSQTFLVTRLDFVSQSVRQTLLVSQTVRLRQTVKLYKSVSQTMSNWKLLHLLIRSSKFESCKQFPFQCCKEKNMNVESASSCYKELIESLTLKEVKSYILYDFTISKTSLFIHFVLQQAVSCIKQSSDLYDFAY